MSIVTDYHGWGKSHNGKGVGSHILGEQFISTNPHGNGRTTSQKITAEELDRQRERLRQIAKNKSKH
jgi:hypothetical protein